MKHSKGRKGKDPEVIPQGRERAEQSEEEQGKRTVCAEDTASFSCGFLGESRAVLAHHRLEQA